jgi:molybdopterin-guanine dinucleotide biosynthesis protein B
MQGTRELRKARARTSRKKRPFMLCVMGTSDSGKTTLILKILPELQKRGYTVAVAKHCPRGFDLDVEGKDSWRFTKAGSGGVYLSSRTEEAILRPRDAAVPLQDRLQSYFSDFDIVLLEGYSEEPGIDKIQILRKGVEAPFVTSDDIIGYVSDRVLKTKKPVYGPRDIPGIISFIEAVVKQ